MSAGSDGILVVDGLLMQAVAELWAAERILAGQMALLTMFHHARSLYEAHALASWMLQDFQARWPRVIKERQIERDRFERAAVKSVGSIETDITPAGRALIDDTGVKKLPTMFDMIQGNPVLEFDHAIFWKFASAHTHAGHIYRARVDSTSERTMIDQLLGGLIRHAAGTLREIATAFEIRDPETIELLSNAEEFARYDFPLPGPSEQDSVSLA